MKNILQQFRFQNQFISLFFQKLRKIRLENDENKDGYRPMHYFCPSDAAAVRG